jgi:hypothetical protein
MPGDPQSDAPLFDGESLAKVPLEAQIGQKRKMSPPASMTAFPSILKETIDA